MGFMHRTIPDSHHLEEVLVPIKLDILVDQEDLSQLNLDFLARLEITYSLSKGVYTVEQSQLLACALFIAYRNGLKDENDFVLLPEDIQLKADYYLAHALFLNRSDPAGFFLRYLARITSSRLAIVRCFRLHPLSFLALNVSSGILFNAFQLSYFLEIAVCVSILIEKSLRPKTSAEEGWIQRIEGRRFIHALTDREFLSIFTNAMIWGLVNGVCYFDPSMGLATKALWNLGGYFLDIVHDWGFARWELNEYKDLKQSIDNKQFKIEGFDLKDPSFQAKLVNKINIVEFKEKRLWSAAILIFLAMILVFSPALVPALLSASHVPSILLPFLMKITPDIAKGLKSIGSIVVIFAGVLLAGLGGRLFFTDFSWAKIKTCILDVWAGRGSEWFNTKIVKKAIKDFSSNFALNALVPLGSMGALMLMATFVCSVPTVIVATCIVMAATFFLMKMNFPFLPFTAAPSNHSDSSIRLIPRIDDLTKNRLDAKNKNYKQLKISKLRIMPRETLTNELQFMQASAEVDQDTFVTVMKDWTKPKNKQPSSTTKAINKMMAACSMNQSTDSLASTSSSENDAKQPEESSSISPRSVSPQVQGLRKRPIVTPLIMSSPPDIQKKGSWFNLFCCIGDSASSDMKRQPSMPAMPSVRG